MSAPRDTSPQVRPVRASDAADLARHCFPDQPVDAVQGYLEWCVLQVGKGRMVRLVAEVEGCVVASVQLDIRHLSGEVGSLVVAPSHRMKGIGNALLDALDAEASRRGLRALEIAADPRVPWVRAWYERRGFVFAGTRELPRGDCLVVLRKRLKSTAKHGIMPVQ